MPHPVVVAALFAAPLLAAASATPAQTTIAGAAVATAARATPAPARPAKLGQCVGCHGERGRSRVAGTPHLGGQDGLYLANALRAYRAGTRAAVPMNAIANTLQPRDIAALAAWYSAQPGGLR
jgi:cytochrome c553